MNKFNFLIFFCFYAIALFSEKKEVTFAQVVGKEKSEQKWTLEENDKNLKIICAEDEGVTTIDFSKNYQMNKYSFKSSDSKEQYSLALQGKTVVATGIVDGKKINTKCRIKTPWVQQFSFAMKPFIISKERSMEFSLINPKNFSVQRMVIKKKAIENVSIEGKAFKAQKAIIKLSGFKGAFWEAELWFEKSTGDFLKYRATSGPNTPLTTIWLSKK